MSDTDSMPALASGSDVEDSSPNVTPNEPSEASDGSAGDSTGKYGVDVSAQAVLLGGAHRLMAMQAAMQIQHGFDLAFLWYRFAYLLWVRCDGL